MKSYYPKLTLFVLCSFAVLAGCDRSRGGIGGDMTWEAASGDWTDDEKWQLVPDLWIGAILGEPEEEFGDLDQFAVDGWNRVFALDRMNLQVRLFDADGRYVRGFGRRGTGPGDLMQPNGIRLDPAGNLWVIDVGTNRYTVFDSAGEFLRTYPRPITGHGFRFTGGFDDGALIEAFPPTIRLDPRTAQVDTITLIDRAELAAGPGEPVSRTAFEIVDSERQRRFVAVPFRSGGGGSVLAGADRRIWRGTRGTDRYAITLMTFDGDTIRVIEKERTPVPVSKEDIEWFIQSHRIPRDMVDMAVFPAHKPAFHDFFVDDQDYVWVWTSPDAQYELPDAHTTRLEELDVFDPRGQFLGTVRFGPAVKGALALAPPGTAELFAEVAIHDYLDHSPIPLPRGGTRHRLPRQLIDPATGRQVEDPAALADTTLFRLALWYDPPTFSIQAIRGPYLYAMIKGKALQAIVRYRIVGRD